jgi:hypothetical protein
MDAIRTLQPTILNNRPPLTGGKTMSASISNQAILAIETQDPCQPFPHLIPSHPFTMASIVTNYDLEVVCHHATIEEATKFLNELLADIPSKEVLLKHNGIFYTLAKIRLNPACPERPLQFAVFVKEFTTRRYSVPLSAASNCKLFGLTPKAREILWNISTEACNLHNINL